MSDSLPPGLGTPNYIPSLANRVRTANPDLPVDSIVLQSLLLCLIARLPSLHTAAPCVGVSTGVEQSQVDTGICAHLILRTTEEDIGLLANLVTLTLTSVLGLPTHKHKISTGQTHRTPHKPRSKSRTNTADATSIPSAFLRSLFFRKPSTRSPAPSRPHTRVRSRLSTDSGPTNTIGTSQRSTKTHTQKRSSSYPVPSPLLLDGSDSDPYDAASFASSRRPLLTLPTPTSSVRSRGTLNRPRPQRLRTDPLPSVPGVTSSSGQPVNRPPTRESDGSGDVTPRSRLRSDEVPTLHSTSEAPRAVLPKAVVVTGLENAPLPAQRALSQALTERRLVLDEHVAEGVRSPQERTIQETVEGGTWNLPDDFLLVYVCKWDGCERPPVLRSLLDQFAMSADVALSPLIRNAYAAYRTTHGPTLRPSSFPSTPDGTFTTNRSPPIRPQLSLHASSHSRSSSFPTLPSSSIILPSELALLRTLAAPHPTDVPGVRPCPCSAFDLPVHAHTALHPSLRLYMTDLFAAVRHHPELEGTLVTRRAAVAAEALVRAFRVLGGDAGGTELVRLAAGVSDVDFGAHSMSESASMTGSGRVSMGLGEEWESVRWEATAGVGTEMNPPLDLRVNIEPPEDTQSQRRFAESLATTTELVPAVPKSAAVWDVSEIDIARVFPRIVTHRLRVRDGPADEILGGVIFPAVSTALGASMRNKEEEVDGHEYERRTVKEILVNILADV